MKLEDGGTCNQKGLALRAVEISYLDRSTDYVNRDERKNHSFSPFIRI